MLQKALTLVQEEGLRTFVAISYRKGVDFCSEYDKCDGDYFANFICREFPKTFRRSAKSHSKLVRFSIHATRGLA